MPRIGLDLSGMKFGRLTVIHRADTRSNSVRWLCVCDCGTTKIVGGSDLRSGKTKSCGCFCREKTRRMRLTHGMKESPEYGIWCQMKARCYNPNSTYFINYGGRGIKVCERWHESFEAFYKDMGPRPSPDHSLDRIDNDGDYEPSNVRWATRIEQGCNKRNNVLITRNGETHAIAQWSRITGISASTLYSRVRRGMDENEILNPPN